MAARDRYKTDTWYDAPSRHGRNNYNKQQYKGQADAVKFFVSNLPERCSSSDLKEILTYYGYIQGVYIARKLDRLGKRFGFASFKVTRNRTDLEENLRDVWIGSYKLFIVPARFVDGQRVLNDKDKGKAIDRTVHGEKVWKLVNEPTPMDSVETEVRVENLQADNIQNTGCDNRSFKDTLLNKPVEVTIPEVIVDSEGKAFDDLYDVGLVANVSSFGMFSSLRKLLKEVAKTQCDIKYVAKVDFMLFCLLFLVRKRRFSWEIERFGRTGFRLWSLGLVNTWRWVE
ncbi:putative RNA recognition motif domain, nucleotide-binding alpha-beta plait domain superfamily [Helianthus annuus]|nr:putative RNA recognition motif domain, nucleotide-binding alpha-beta plait domain superfamily [Helianthus annuus]